jgi:DNA gyrase subunit A
MGLREVLGHYILHRHEVIVRRAQFEIDKALDREHILEGLKIAVDHIDEVIKVIRKADNPEMAGAQLQKRFKLTERQADAILNMRLARLTALEVGKIEEELKDVRSEIKGLRELLESRPKRMALMKSELTRIVEKYGDDRRTEITSDQGDFTIEDLIAEEDMVVTVSHSGYIKRTSITTYRRQRRGGKGLTGQELRDEDFVERMYVGSTHDYILVFTNDGRCYWLKVYEIPQAGRATKGKPIVNLINVSPDTQIQAMVFVREFKEDEFLLFCTRNGTVKKTRLSEYSNVRTVGIKAIKVEPRDQPIEVAVTSGNNAGVIATRPGLSIRFHEADAREMGRDTTGVKGIELGDGDRVVGMVVIKREATLLCVTEKGLGKCTHIDEYRVQRRGGKGILTVNRTEKTGDVVGLMEVLPEDEIMIITRGGMIIRSPVSQVRVAGRNTQGVKLVNLDGGDVVTAVARVIPEDDKEVPGANGEEPSPDAPELALEEQ